MRSVVRRLARRRYDDWIRRRSPPQEYLSLTFSSERNGTIRAYHGLALGSVQVANESDVAIEVVALDFEVGAVTGGAFRVHLDHVGEVQGRRSIDVDFLAVLPLPLPLARGCEKPEMRYQNINLSIRVKRLLLREPYAAAPWPCTPPPVLPRSPTTLYVDG